MELNSYASIINDKIKILPEIGNVMPYKDFMNILFGGNMKSVSKLELINQGFIVNLDEMDGEIYFLLEHISDYIKYVLKRIDWESEKLCPINYFNCLEKMGLDVPMTEMHSKIFKIVSEYKNFLKEKEDNHSKILLKLFWDEKFEGFITSTNINPFLITLVFPKKDSLPFILNITDGDFESKNSLSIDKVNDYTQIYDDWINNLLLQSSENYVITCLEQVTGSIDLAKFIFFSHNEKEKYLIKSSSLNQIVNFKKTKEKDYINKFMDIYKDNDIYESTEDELYLNFEGFNKYLLNIDADYLENFEQKEIINTLYYNVMDELVNSYKKLYLFFRKNLFNHENQSGCMV